MDSLDEALFGIIRYLSKITRCRRCSNGVRLKGFALECHPHVAEVRCDVGSAATNNDVKTWEKVSITVQILIMYYQNNSIG